MKFRNDLKEGLLDFVWQQWCRLGIAGTSQTKTSWVIDPEVLLAFTSEMGRYDARLFDQVLDWLAVNGSWINAQRLSTIMKQDSIGCPAVMGAVASWMCDRDKSMKWRGIARRNHADAYKPTQPLFRAAHADTKHAIDQPDRHFEAYGLLREEIHTRDMAKPVDMNDVVNIMFKSRALFGIGIRADVMVYLLTNDGGHARRIAELLGYNHMRVHEVLTGLAHAGFVSVRAVGRAKHYWIDRRQWAPVLCQGKTPDIQWVNWRPLTRGLTAIWREAWSLEAERADDYIVSSKMREVMRASREDLYASGIAFDLTGEERYVAEDYLPVLAKDVNGILESISTAHVA